MNKQSEQTLRTRAQLAFWEANTQALLADRTAPTDNVQVALNNWSGAIDVQAINNARALAASTWIEQRKTGITLVNLRTEHPPQWQSKMRQS